MTTLVPWPNPRWKENPYQRLLYRELGKHGVRILRTPWRFDFLPLRGAFHWLHLNWPDTLYASPDPETQRRRFGGFVRVVERLKRNGTRILWTVHNEFPHENVDARFHRRANETLVGLADLIHVHFRAAETVLHEAYGADAGKVLVLPHGHYGDYYGPPLPRAAAKATFGVPADARLLLSLGYVRGYKGLERAVASFEACRDERLHYVIAGEPADEGLAAFLRAAAARNPRLVLHPRKIEERDFPRFLSAADAFLFPSREFFTSGSVMLALTYGLPVIAVPMNHTLEFVGASFFQPWTPPDGETLTRIMETLDAWLATVDAAALRDVRRTLAWERVAPALAERLVRCRGAERPDERARTGSEPAVRVTPAATAPRVARVPAATRYCCYRHRLFRPSEPFVTQQAEALERYRAVYAGWSVEGAPPAGAAVHTLDRAAAVVRARSSLFRDGRALAAALASHEPALVHAHFGVEGVYALDVARRLGVPLVTTFHGADATSSRAALLRTRLPSRLNYLAFRRRLAREGDLFLCVSEFIREKVLELGFPAERTVVHYIGVDVGEKGEGRGETRGAPPGPVPITQRGVGKGPVILHIARLVEKKGTRFLLDAFVRVARAVPGARLVIVGDGALRRPLEAHARTLGLAERVAFQGAQPHASVLAAMRSVRLVCLPSVTAASGDSEGLGMVVLEAGAMGLPVVATRHGGIPEAVDDGRTGFLVPERDVAVLADRLSMLLNDTDLAARMGAAARARVAEHFDLAKQGRKLERLFDTVRRKESLPTSY